VYPVRGVFGKIGEDMKDGKNRDETLVLDAVCLPFCEYSSGSALSIVTPLSCYLRMAGNSGI
jgi:hypothetical protein